MAFNPLAEVVVHVVVEGAVAAVDAGSGPRRRLWLPTLGGGLAALVLLFVVPLPWCLLLAAATAGAAAWSGVRWQRAHERQRAARAVQPVEPAPSTAGHDLPPASPGALPLHRSSDGASRR